MFWLKIGGALALVALLGYAGLLVKWHFDEFARLEQAEADLTKQRDEAIDANEEWATEVGRQLRESARREAAAKALADRERRGHDDTRRQLTELQNAPGRDEAMPPVFDAAFDIVRQRRSRNSPPPGPGGPLSNTPGPAVLPGTAPASP